MHAMIYGALVRTAPDFVRIPNSDPRDQWADAEIVQTAVLGKSPERLLTELDFARLSKLQRLSMPGGLKTVLGAADTLQSSEIPADIVTMYTQVEVEDPQTGARQRLTLCYPGDAELAAGFVSVLSPVGSSLLGLSVGSIAHWRTPGGAQGEAQVVSILFQPEASGDYTL